MSFAPISAVTSYTPASTAAASSVTQKTLGQDDFLKLVVTELSNQDPLNPQKDTEFIAQMAQFTSLEQTKAMTSNISKLTSQQQILQANGMLGKTVTLQVSKDTQVQGTVTAVNIAEGTPTIVVDGQGYDLSQVLTITPAVH
jgi:flagellar basal-body rod modification protein FlgD